VISWASTQLVSIGIHSDAMDCVRLNQSMKKHACNACRIWFAARLNSFQYVLWSWYIVVSTLGCEVICTYVHVANSHRRNSKVPGHYFYCRTPRYVRLGVTIMITFLCVDQFFDKNCGYFYRKTMLSILPSAAFLVKIFLNVCQLLKMH
jgi:hypothetical protein